MSHAFLLPLLLSSPSLLLLFLLLLLGIKRVKSNNLNLPPSPPKLPIIGNLHQLGPLTHRSLRDLSSKYGPLMLLQLGHIPAVVVSSHELAHEVLKTHDTIFGNRPAPSKITTHVHTGSDKIPFAPYGESWRPAKKLSFAHLLSPQMVRSFGQVKEKEVELMMEKVAEISSSGRAVNMTDILNRFASHVLSSAVFANASRKNGRTWNERVHQLGLEQSKLVGEFHPGDFFPIIGRVDLFGVLEKAKRLGKRWNDLLDEIIDEHTKDGGPGDKDTNFVDALLAHEIDSPDDFSLTRESTKAMLIDMLFAGADTTYTGLEWSMAELVRNPRVMEKLQDEVRGAVPGKGLVRERDANGMSYLKAVVKEVTRFHPPVPILVPRETSEDCQLGGHHIPQKMRVMVNAWAIARDPKVWDDPEEFKPERFLGSSLDFRGKDFEFIPFGAGRRICPGMNFAAQTIELTVANLVHRFDWELPGNMAIEELDMSDAPGLIVRRKQKLELVARLPTGTE